MDPNIRLRIATRIHFALLRHYDEDVAVTILLRDADVARETLWVCEASGIDELVLLGQQFKTATRQEARAAQLLAQQRAHAEAAGTTPQDLAWSRDTSGFGLSRPLEMFELPMPKAPAWLAPLKPSNWLRFGSSSGNSSDRTAS